MGVPIRVHLAAAVAVLSSETIVAPRSLGVEARGAHVPRHIRRTLRTKAAERWEGMRTVVVICA